MEVQWLGLVEYGAALEIQNRLVDECLASGSEKLLLLEHEDVYTIGRTRDQSSLGSATALPHPVFETNRGGQATWHGPGQLVAYPILNLAERGRDLHRYLRFLEEIVILTCEKYSVAANRREGLTGVWIRGRKVASIGIGVRHWISMHGLALNVCSSSLEAFRHITPCGIADVEMTCLEQEAGVPVDVPAVAETLSEIFLRELPRMQA